VTDTTPLPEAPGGKGSTLPPVIAVITALPEERDGVRTAMGVSDTEIIPRDEHGIPGIDLPVALVATGAGKVAAATGLLELFNRVHPRVLLCGGIAGALDPALAPGTAIIAERCWYYDRDATAVRLPLGAVTRSGPDRFEFPAAGALAGRLGWPSGTIATGDSVVTARLRDALPREWRDRLAESSLVDMESAVWAELANEYGTPAVICRTVYDVIGERSVTSPDAPGRITFRDACARSGEALVAVLRELSGFL